MFALFDVSCNVNSSTQVGFTEKGICVYVRENKDYVLDGSKGQPYTKCKFGNNSEMQKAEGVFSPLREQVLALHALLRYADFFG